MYLSKRKAILLIGTPYILLLAVLLTCLGLWLYDGRNATKTNYLPEYPGITMTAVEGTATPTAIDVIWRNDSDHDIFGQEEMFWIDQRRWGRWYPNRNTFEWFLMPFRLQPGEERLISYSWLYTQMELPPGRYRVCTSIAVDGEDGRYQLTCEFTIP